MHIHVADYVHWMSPWEIGALQAIGILGGEVNPVGGGLLGLSHAVGFASAGFQRLIEFDVNRKFTEKKRGYGDGDAGAFNGLFLSTDV